METQTNSNIGFKVCQVLFFLSIPFHGLAVNILLGSFFGLIGIRQELVALGFMFVLPVSFAAGFFLWVILWLTSDISGYFQNTVTGGGKKKSLFRMLLINLFFIPLSFVIAAGTAIYALSAPVGSDSGTPDEDENAPLPFGSFAFIIASVLICSLMGLIAAVFSESSFFRTMILYFSVGTAYGFLLWWAANKRLLPTPD